ncbi:MAG: hypothetical protein PVJ01_00010 [Pseudomonadota bacterium]|jgi:hypothetical protein
MTLKQKKLIRTTVLTVLLLLLAVATYDYDMWQRNLPSQAAKGDIAPSDSPEIPNAVAGVFAKKQSTTEPPPEADREGAAIKQTASQADAGVDIPGADPGLASVVRQPVEEAEVKDEIPEPSIVVPPGENAGGVPPPAVNIPSPIPAEPRNQWISPKKRNFASDPGPDRSSEQDNDEGSGHDDQNSDGGSSHDDRNGDSGSGHDIEGDDDGSGNDTDPGPGGDPGCSGGKDRDKDHNKNGGSYNKGNSGLTGKGGSGFGKSRKENGCYSGSRKNGKNRGVGKSKRKK